MKQTITILGSTGSIGVSTLDVISRHSDRYQVVALTAHSRVNELAKQCVQFKPKFAVVGSVDAADALKAILAPYDLNINVLFGEAALCDVARECDVVMAAIVGAAGLAPTMAAAKAGKKVLLANKEALVMSGQLFMDAVRENGATLLPIDSEHNAIFQCLPHDFNLDSAQQGIAKILLTASGGPFLHRPINTLHDVTPEQAIAHPNWVMGKKISIDSATMMNKGLEVIEAHWLFAVPVDQIEVVIHPQSVIHSMVSYVDGSMLAQLGNPDMRTPIAYGLAYPERITSGVPQLDITKIAQLQFEKPDFSRFPCLAIAFDALRAGDTAPAIMNAANEVAVQAFLDKKIGFLMIPELITSVMNKIANSPVIDLDGVMEQDALAREAAMHFIASY
ncbi:1-deoxy-D-xylulose-5-phosphate reductoisomerase [Solimicrobium silvestre]|uniref:1-deoxy-D-xylulose 5-phosphate reductoisomerase n=1 Tax=Solimicrobium silvestre TaxID=2099400 RepID=A0A2S9GWQ6_9BURK|nr:1-deoxy-D-xylulose-5-phosphate reductoisomerase [Solimicrobium silvestre]PRC92152.1 Dxr: 1-deoxy-D-xylulose 5-phosphate reductoisomerase [Solimicrobium silvestre]